MPEVIQQAVLGFRLFKISDDERSLRSVYSKVQWKPGENIAFCLRTESSLNTDHESPSIFCSCGLQAYNELGELPLDPSVFNSFAVALVAGAGKVCVHDLGWRAEKAAILTLCLPEYKHYPDTIVKDIIQLQENIAGNYEVPLVRSSSEFRKLAKDIPSAKLFEPSYSKIKNKIFQREESVMNELFQNCFRISNSNDSFRMPREISFIDLMFNREDISPPKSFADSFDKLETKPLTEGNLYKSSLTPKEQMRLDIYQKASWPGIHIAMLVSMILLAFSPVSSLPLALIGAVLATIISITAVVIFIMAYKQHQRVLMKIRLENGF